MSREETLRSAIAATTNETTRRLLQAELDASSAAADHAADLSGPPRFVVERSSIDGMLRQASGARAGIVVMVNNGFESRGGEIIAELSECAWLVEVSGSRVVAFDPDRAWEP